VALDQADDCCLFVGIEDPVEHPELRAALEGGLVLERERDVGARLALAVSRNEVVSHDTKQYEDLGLGG
jgi:hypothetical protein